MPHFSKSIRVPYTGEQAFDLVSDIRAYPDFIKWITAMRVSDEVREALANGKPIVVPSQDIVLGLYYLSVQKDNEPGEGLIFTDTAELEHALDSGAVTLHAKIKMREQELMMRGVARTVALGGMRNR